MHPVMVEYLARFPRAKTTQWDYFFTQLKQGELQKLPYINQVEKFCVRVAQAIERGERICIYSDYDTDAVTATATMYWGLLSLGVQRKKLDFYAPDRFTEGYGMNVEAAAKLAEEYDLIITVDCGINSREEAKIVGEKGAELLITDHHALVGDLPECAGVINCRLNSLPPSLPVDNEFGLDVEQLNLLPDTITGVGVAWFALVWLGYYLRDVRGQVIEMNALNLLLPYVGIGTIADCQSILEPVNRLLVKTALQILQKPVSHPGLEELTKQTGLREKTTQGYRLTSQDFGFTYAPILNASGRIAHASLSIGTLVAEAQAEAQQKARELIQVNQDRKALVKSILQEVESRAEAQVGDPFIWLVGDWNKGIIGLLASRLVNQYDKPVLVMSREEETISASLRAPEGYDLPAAMAKFAPAFLKAGGHPGAAGFKAKSAQLDEIRAGFEKYLGLATQEGDRKQLRPSETELPVDLQGSVPHLSRIVLGAAGVSPELMASVLAIDPYGQDFPYPEFVFPINEFETRFMGKEANHAKLTTETGTVTMFYLSPELKEHLEQKPTDRQLWVGAKVSQNTWNGRTNSELIANNYWLV